MRDFYAPINQTAPFFNRTHFQIVRKFMKMKSLMGEFSLFIFSFSHIGYRMQCNELFIIVHESIMIIRIDFG